MSWAERLLADQDRLERARKRDLISREVQWLKAEIVRLEAEGEARQRVADAQLAYISRVIQRRSERPN